MRARERVLWDEHVGGPVVASSRSWWSLVLAVGVGVVALVLALVSGLAMEQVRSTYSWGLPAAPEGPGWVGVGSQGRFTPLLLAAPPFAWDVRWSCDAGLVVPSSGDIEVFGSMAHVGLGPAVRVTRGGGTFAVDVGGGLLVEVPALGGEGGSCWYRLGLDDAGGWRVVEGDRTLGSGTITDPPALTGFGSDLAGGSAEAVGRVEVVVTTQRHGSTGSAAVRVMQGAALVLGVVSVLFLMKAWRVDDGGVRQ